MSLDIEPAVKKCRVPKLVLQPLAENAITYCLEPFIEPCHIQIKAYKKGEFVYLKVADNGPGMDEDFLEKARKEPYPDKRERNRAAKYRRAHSADVWQRVWLDDFKRKE